MADGWQQQFTAEALAKVDAFIAENPDCAREGVEQPEQGATNRVLFLRRGAELVVFKFFCHPERKERESFAFRHWGETGLLPGLVWDADPRTIVMTHLPGTSLPASRQVDGEEAWREACRGVGKAIASLTQVPLGAAARADFEPRFYEGLGPLEAYLGRVVELGRSIQARDPDFRDRFWCENLDFIESQLDVIYSQPRILYQQDIANLCVQQGRFVGFFDLEMCRVGCAAMQLASSLGMLHGSLEGYELLREGWEAAAGSRLSLEERRAAAACQHLLCWREISRYLSYDGTPGTGHAWAEPADPVRYRKSIEEARRMLGI